MVEKVVGGRVKNGKSGKKKRKDEKEDFAVAGDALISTEDNDSIKIVEEKKRKKLPRRKKEKTVNLGNVADEPEHETLSDQEEAARESEKLRGGEKKKKKKKKKSKWEKGVNDKVENIMPTSNSVHENNQDRTLDEKRSQKSSGKKKRKAHAQSEVHGDDQTMTDNEADRMNGNPKKAKRKDKKAPNLSLEGDKNLKVEGDPNQEEVYQISSGDEDSSKGMKKWVTEYNQSRPGLEVLQGRIDEFITVHEAQLEQERKEREERAAEGGWTVVTHHKGRKKTTDAESGTVVGSVSQTALEIKVAKKKTKEAGLDFYRFQKREAKRTELMMLQSKFEQDKKRIQELRAARKFRPY